MEAVRGQLDLVLLAELGRGAGHGYALIERIRDRSGGGFDFPEGSIYPALHRLERAGLLKSTWSTGKARRRRIYSIRRRGRRVLADHLREWRLFALPRAASAASRTSRGRSRAGAPCPGATS